MYFRYPNEFTYLNEFFWTHDQSCSDNRGSTDVIEVIETYREKAGQGQKPYFNPLHLSAFMAWHHAYEIISKPLSLQMGRDMQHFLSEFEALITRVYRS